MNKTQIWDATKLLLTNEKIEIDSNMYKQLELLLAPKKAGAEFPPIKDEEGNIVEAYCQWHKKYEPIAEFTLRDNKPHHECKTALIEWRKYAKQIKVVEKEINSLINDILDEVITPNEAKEIKAELTKDIELLRANRAAKINYDEQ